MSDPIALISSDEITPEQFTAFLERIGGAVNSDDKFKGRFSSGYLHIWVFLSPEELESLEPTERELIVQKLGATPRSCIVFEISRKVGSEQLAIELARTFSERWRIIVYNFLDKVYSIQELSNLNQTGGRL